MVYFEISIIEFKKKKTFSVNSVGGFSRPDLAFFHLDFIENYGRMNFDK